MVASWCYHFKLFKLFYSLPADSKRDESKHAESTINKPPANRNPSYFSGDESKRKNHQAGNHPEFNHPDIFYRVFKRADKHHCYHEVSKSQPVRTISDKRKLFVGNLQAGIHQADP